MYRLILAALICSIVPLQAGVLWYQAPDTVAAAYVDQEFPDYAGYSTYQVHDVTVDPGGWTIQSITSYYTVGWGSWPSTASVRVNIFPKSGSLPLSGDDPTVGTVYAATLSVSGSSTLVTVGGLSIPLAAGDWWIGLTPILLFGSDGQEYHQVVADAVVGDYSAVRNPGGSFGFGTAWATYTALGRATGGDGAILIEGVGGAIPEPATWSLLALGVGALAFLRRRK